MKRLIAKKLAGLIGLTIAIYIPLVAVISFGLADKIASGDVVFTKLLGTVFFIEVSLISLGLLGIGAMMLGRKSIEWLTE